MKTASRNLITILFVAYLIFVIYMMFFVAARHQLLEYDYNLVPLKTIIDYSKNLIRNPIQNFRYWFINVFANIVFFMPFGIFARLLWQKMKFKKFLLIFLIFITILEILQLVFKIGTFDVDDILLNTVGAGLGFIIVSSKSTSQK